MFAAQIRGNQLTGREWDWHDGILVQIAGEQLGEERVTAALENATDGAIRLFGEGWRSAPQKEARPDPSAYRAEMRSMTAGDIAAAESSKSPFGLFRSWGDHADEADLQQILRHLRASEEPVVIANLLKVFTSRKLPQFDVRCLNYASTLMPMCESERSMLLRESNIHGSEILHLPKSVNRR